MTHRRDMSPRRRVACPGRPRPRPGMAGRGRLLGRRPASVGREWDAVVLPYDRMLAMADGMSPLAMEDGLILGDLICGWVYVLVPDGTAKAWGTACAA